MAELGEGDIGGDSEYVTKSEFKKKVKAILKKAIVGLTIATIALVIALVNTVGMGVHQANKLDAGAEDPTKTQIDIDKVGLGRSYVAGMIAPAGYSYAECGLRNNGKSTTVYYKLTDEKTQKSHIREVVFEGVSANKTDDLYTRIYDLSQEDSATSLDGITIKGIYNEVSDLNAVMPGKQAELSGIEGKLKEIFTADGSDVANTKVYQAYNSSEKDGKVSKSLAFCVVAQEGETYNVEKVAFAQNGASDEVTTNALVDNIATRLDNGIPTGKFKMVGETDEKTLKIDELIALNSAPAQSGTETESGTVAGDPNAELGA